MIRRYAALLDFYPDAAELRACVDAHFDKPYDANETTHGIWNYWFVPQMYTYLRCDPHRLFGDALNRFMTHLRAWSAKTLGITAVSSPSCHLYVDGCGQGLHSDFHNGVFGWVYSLTRWEARQFQGGETLIFRDGNPNYKRHHVSGEALYELIPARFNQLLVFDDRIVHCVRPLQGTMDPREGRIVLNGHFFGGIPVVDGPVDAALVRRQVWESISALRDRLSSFRDSQGMLSVRLHVSAEGVPSNPELLFNNIVSSAATGGTAQAATDAILEHLLSLRFPSAPSPWTVSVPVLVPLPPLTAILIEQPHSLGRARAKEKLIGIVDLIRVRGEGLDGRWEGDVFHAVAPGDGLIEVDDTRVRARLEVPMMNPSQSRALELQLQTRFKEQLGGEA